MTPTLEEYWNSNALDHWGDLWDSLTDGADPIVESDYEPTLSGLDAYLIAGGVKFFSAAELTRPHGGWTGVLLPPQRAWVGLLVLSLVADRLRMDAGRPVKCRNAWRPPSYNELLHGAPYSDHLWCCALDLDFTGAWWNAVRARRSAQRLVEEIVPRKLLSLGTGWRTLHVGFAAPRTLAGGKHRRWKYGKLPKTEMYLV